jgi:DNA-directed RNA polymerase beta' subunit
MQSITKEIEEFEYSGETFFAELHINIISFVNIPAKTWERPEDCYEAETKLEWKIEEILLYQEGKLKKSFDKYCKYYLSVEEEDKIEREIWNELTTRDNDYYD